MLSLYSLTISISARFSDLYLYREAYFYFEFFPPYKIKNIITKNESSGLYENELSGVNAGNFP